MLHTFLGRSEGDACNGAEFTVTRIGKDFKLQCDGGSPQGACEGATFDITVDTDTLVGGEEEHITNLDCASENSCKDATIKVTNSPSQGGTDQFVIEELNCGENGCSGLTLDMTNTEIAVCKCKENGVIADCGFSAGGDACNSVTSALSINEKPATDESDNTFTNEKMETGEGDNNNFTKVITIRLSDGTLNGLWGLFAMIIGCIVIYGIVCWYYRSKSSKGSATFSEV